MAFARVSTASVFYVSTGESHGDSGTWEGSDCEVGVLDPWIPDDGDLCHVMFPCDSMSNC